MRLVQISDTHFGTERPEIVSALQRCIVDMQPDVILLCGDITQRARRWQFAAARRFMDAMPASAAQIVIPGNHDLPVFNLLARAVAPYRNYERAFRARESTWSGSGVFILALDATHPMRIRDGALPASRLRERLAAADATRRPGDVFVVAAHQPLWTAWTKDGPQTLVGRDETARIFSEARVDLVLSGHVHVPLLDTSDVLGIPLPWRFALSGSGTAVSHRTRVGVPNSFNVIDFSRRELTILQHDYAGSAFALARSLRLRRAADGWAIGSSSPEPVPGRARERLSPV